MRKEIQALLNETKEKKYSKLSDKQLERNENLKIISSLGSFKGGNSNVNSGHMNKLNSVSSKNRSERRKKHFSKEYIIQIMNKYPFNKDRAAVLKITQVTLRRILKDYKLYKKETATSKMLKVYSAEERSKLLNSHKNKK